MLGRLINRHKNCGGFILPDIENSFSGMDFGYCPKCGKNKLTLDDYDSKEEHITLYTIHNKSTGETLLNHIDDNRVFTIQFESEQQANDFAEMHNVTNYEVRPNVALFCGDIPVTNGRMIIGEGGEK